METIIKHKYTIGQRVYFLDKNHRCVSDTIKSISPFIYKDYVTVWYQMEETLLPLRDDELFATEADLKNHIFNGTLDIV